MSPFAVATVAAAILAAISFVLLRPRRGWLWRWIAALRDRDRIRIEDALKHLHDGEYRGQRCTLHSLAGVLELPGGATATLLERLEELGLVTRSGRAYTLTEPGRRYALRVIRVHRLWERYLSDETGLDPSEWHREAERREHDTTTDEAEALAARMGFPRYDPHGDPIPTSSGEIVSPRGVPLADLDVGQIAEVVHVEDEPDSVYRQILAEELFPGVRARIVEASSQGIRFEADGEVRELTPVAAANVWAVPIEESEPVERTRERLAGLIPGRRVRVSGISARCRGPERRRILDLGFIPGTEVEAELAGPSGDPTAYRVRGALIALRRSQAELIHVEPIESGGVR